MNEWGVVTVIIALFAFVGAIIKCVVPLTNSITTLNCTVKQLNDRIDGINKADSKQDEKIEDNEIRIT